MILIIIMLIQLNLRYINKWKVARSAAIWRFACGHAGKLANLRIFMVDKVKGFISIPNVQFY